MLIALLAFPYEVTIKQTWGKLYLTGLALRLGFISWAERQAGRLAMILPPCGEIVVRCLSRDSSRVAHVSAYLSFAYIWRSSAWEFLPNSGFESIWNFATRLLSERYSNANASIQTTHISKSLPHPHAGQPVGLPICESVTSARARDSLVYV